MQDVVAGYVDELAGVREMLDSRYDDLKSGRVKPIDGEAFFEQLREREEERLKRSRVTPALEFALHPGAAQDILDIWAMFTVAPQGRSGPRPGWMLDTSRLVVVDANTD